jgi:amino acid transporter
MTGQLAGNAGASAPFVLIAASFVCLSLALTIKEFSKYISSSGSFYAFVSMGLGKEMGFVCGWLMICGYSIITVETLLQIGCYVSDIISRNFPDVIIHWGYPVIVFGGLVALMAWIGVNPALKLSLILSVFESIIIFGLCVAIVVKSGSDGNYPLAFTPFTPYNGGMRGLLEGLVPAMLVFVGFETSAVLGEESENPGRNIGISVVASILITVAYMAFGMYAFVVAIGPENAFGLKSLPSPADFFARKFVGRWAAWLIDLAGMSATFNAASSVFNNMYRILYFIGREGVFGLGLLGYTHPKRQTPSVTIALFTIICVVGALASGMLSAPRFVLDTRGCWVAYGYTSFAGVLPIIVVFVLTNPALFFYMRKYQPQHFSWFKHAVLPALSTLLLMVPLVGNFVPSLPDAPEDIFLFLLIGWAMFGVVLALVLSRFAAESLEKMGRAFMAKSDDEDDVLVVDDVESSGFASTEDEGDIKTFPELRGSIQ